jgi:hypothetical protein
MKTSLNFQNLTPKKALQKSEAKGPRSNLFESAKENSDVEDFFQRRLNFSLGGFDLEGTSGLENSTALNLTPNKHSNKFSSPKHVIFSKNLESAVRDNELMEIEEQISNNLSPSTLNNSPDMFVDSRGTSGHSGFAVPPLKEKNTKCMKKKNLLR